MVMEDLEGGMEDGMGNGVARTGGTGAGTGWKGEMNNID